jgi:ribose transport system substrate-binding protein
MHAGPAHAKQITIGFANEATVAAFQTNVQNGMTKYARQAGYKLISLNNNYDDATALRNAQILANDKVDLAVEFQVDAKIAPAIAATFRKAHIPTISIDIPQPGGVFFGANNFGDGVLTGKALGRYIKSHGWPLTKVTEVLLALPEAGAIPQLRMDGIDYGIRQVVPGLPRKALIEQDGKGTIGDSQKVMANILPGIPKGNHTVVSAINDPSLLGAVRATQLAGRDSMAVYAGQNADPTGLDQIRTNPRWIGDAAYFPEFYGYYIIKLATKMLNHQKVSPYVFIPRLFLSKSNISTYYPGKATVAVRFPPGGLVFSNKPKLKP